MLSSCEEAWKGKQRSKSSIYCIIVEPPEKLISSGPAFSVCELSVKPWHYSPVALLSFPSKSKKILTTSIYWDTKENTT